MGAVFHLDDTPDPTAWPVDRSFIGYAFEAASFVRYAQDDSGGPNDMTMNLMKCVSDRTGGPPAIRVGGSVSDYTTLHPKQVEPALPRIRRAGSRSFKTTVGPSYIGLSNLFIERTGATFVWQVPAAQLDVSESVAWAVEIHKQIPRHHLDAIEIGNEPDLYGILPAAPTDPLKYYSMVNDEGYVSLTNQRINAIDQALGLHYGDRIYQLFDTSMHFDESNALVLDVPTVWSHGIDASRQTKYVAHHFYQIEQGYPEMLGPTLMNHKLITSSLDIFKPWIHFLRTVTDTPIPFILSEVASSSKNAPGYQDTLGAALWSVDWHLYCMSIGVHRVNWQQLLVADFIMWNPNSEDGIPKQTYAPWYSQPFLADMIGQTGDTTVRHVTAQSGTEKSSVVLYAAYDGDALARVVILNLDVWDPSDSALRPAETVTLRNLPRQSKSVLVLSLTTPDGAHGKATNMTYAGSQWTGDSNGVEVKGVVEDTRTVLVSSGQVQVDVMASSAVLVKINGA